MCGSCPAARPLSNATADSPSICTMMKRRSRSSTERSSRTQRAKRSTRRCNRRTRSSPRLPAGFLRYRAPNAGAGSERLGSHHVLPGLQARVHVLLRRVEDAIGSVLDGAQRIGGFRAKRPRPLGQTPLQIVPPEPDDQAAGDRTRDEAKHGPCLLSVRPVGCFAPVHGGARRVPRDREPREGRAESLLGHRERPTHCEVEDLTRVWKADLAPEVDGPECRGFTWYVLEPTDGMRVERE